MSPEIGVGLFFPAVVVVVGGAFWLLEQCEKGPWLGFILGAAVLIPAFIVYGNAVAEHPVLAHVICGC